MLSSIIHTWSVNTKLCLIRIMYINVIPVYSCWTVHIKNLAMMPVGSFSFVARGPYLVPGTGNHVLHRSGMGFRRFWWGYVYKSHNCRARIIVDHVRTRSLLSCSICLSLGCGPSLDGMHWLRSGSSERAKGKEGWFDVYPQISRHLDWHNCRSSTCLSGF